MPIDRNARNLARQRLTPAGGQGGFTLIELAITCVVIAILAGMAITSYEYATIKSRRGAAQACLTEAAQRMERYYTTQMTYLNAPAPTCLQDVSAHYTVRFQNEVAPTATAYTLEAVPKGRQEAKEKQCGTMTIDQAGRRTPNSGCW